MLVLLNSSVQKFDTQWSRYLLTCFNLRCWLHPVVFFLLELRISITPITCQPAHRLVTRLNRHLYCPCPQLRYVSFYQAACPHCRLSQACWPPSLYTVLALPGLLAPITVHSVSFTRPTGLHRCTQCWLYQAYWPPSLYTVLTLPGLLAPITVHSVSFTRPTGPHHCTQCELYQAYRPPSLYTV